MALNLFLATLTRVRPQRVRPLLKSADLPLLAVRLNGVPKLLRSGTRSFAARPPFRELLAPRTTRPTRSSMPRPADGSPSPSAPPFVPLTAETPREPSDAEQRLAGLPNAGRRRRLANELARALEEGGAPRTSHEHERGKFPSARERHHRERSRSDGADGTQEPGRTRPCAGADGVPATRSSHDARLPTRPHMSGEYRETQTRSRC